MSLLAMPWVVINMGCEMVYILDQRLKAQNVSASKSSKVLLDVVTAMLNKSFIDEKLFVPQQMYTMSSIRNIFDRLAHSSIMRLSEASMDKLFDLMVMAAKYQVFCSGRNEDMLPALLRHLTAVGCIMEEALGAGSPDLATVYKLTSNVEIAATTMYGSLRPGQWHLLRCTLGRFFQDKRVRVSLFLCEGIQAPSGRLITPSCVTPDLGSVTSYTKEGGVASRTRLPLAVLQADGNEFFCHPVPFGENLYAKDRLRVAAPRRAHDDKAASASASAAGGAASSAAGEKAALELTGGGQVARQELELLSAVLQMEGRTSKPGAASDNFKLNLFGDDEDGGAGGDSIGTAVADPRFATAPVTAAGLREKRFGHLGVNAAYKQASGLAGMMKELELEEAAAKAGGAQGEPDLLDLLDAAG